MYINNAVIIKNHIMNNIKGLYMTGVLRRKEDEIKELIFITKRPINDIFNELNYYYWDDLHFIQRSPDYISYVFKSEYGRIDLTIYIANDDYEYKFLKWYYNMNIDELNKYSELAKHKGLLLTNRGLKKGDLFIRIPTLKTLKKALNKWNFNDYEKTNNENNIKL